MIEWYLNLSLRGQAEFPQGEMREWDLPTGRSAEACKHRSHFENDKNITQQFHVQNSTIKNRKRGAWVARSAERPTADLNSGLNLRVMGLDPELGSALGVEPTWK